MSFNNNNNNYNNGRISHDLTTGFPRHLTCSSMVIVCHLSPETKVPCDENLWCDTTDDLWKKNNN